MRRTLIGQWGCATRIRLALGLCADQHLDPAGQAGDFCILTGDHLAQIVGQTCQMGQSFLKMLDSGLVLLVQVIPFR